MSARLKAGDELVFAVGIEDTAIGSPLRGGLVLNEHELTGHAQQWREDLLRVGASGATALRYGFPWHRVNPAPGVFDWSWTDEVVEFLVDRVKINVIVDLVHYGAPTWLAGSFIDPGFPGALADYAHAFAARYRGAVGAYTPLNEPLVTASFCGLRGIWPPYLSGDNGWAALVVALMTGVQRAIRAIREADTAAEIVHVEAVQAYQTKDPSLAEEVRLWERRAQLPTGLLLGQVGPDDEDWAWLVRHGVDALCLERLRDGAQRPDVLGLNYYPELSGREIVRLDGTSVHVAVDGGLELLVKELRRAHRAYGLALMVTETAVEGGAEEQCAWVDVLVEGLRGLRSEGVPIVGVTWWPFIDFVDWSWASGGSVVEEFYRRDGDGQPPHPVAPLGVPGGPVAPFLRRMGLYRLEPDAEGDLERRPTRVLARFRTRAVPPPPRPVLQGSRPTSKQGAIMPGSVSIAPRFLGDGKIVFEELPVPSPGPGQLLLRVRANAICGTDRAPYFEGSTVTPGHEAAGVVVAAGPETSVAEGTPGVVFLMDYCGRCRSCCLGFTNQCLAKRADMGFTHDGGYGPYEVVHESNFFAVDAGTDLVEATMLLDVMGTSSHAIGRASLVRPDIESAYIAGAGPIGLGLVVMCKLTFGRDFPVYISDISPWRLNYAESFGARTVDASQPEALAGLEPSDVAFDATGKLAARKGALAALAKRGVLVCVGHGETLEMAVSDELIAPERAVLGSEYFRYEEMARNLELLRDNRALIARVITHRFDVAQITEAFKIFLSGESGKVVVTQELGA